MRASGQDLVSTATLMMLAACGGDGNGKAQQVQPPDPLAAPVVTVDADVKQLIFSWDEVAGATHYRLMENPGGHSGFTQTGNDIPGGTLSVTKRTAAHLHDWVNALYMVQACNSAKCTDSVGVSATDLMLDTIGYITASNADAGDSFHSWALKRTVAVNADGTALVVGAPGEDSCATGVGGDQDDNSCADSGAVYVFRKDEARWFQQAYVKASNSGASDRFGMAVALSSDGNTLAVGAAGEDSMATGINGIQSDNSALGAGAVYLFKYDGSDWLQDAYIKASNTDAEDGFGISVELSMDGNTLAVGSPFEASAAAGIDGDQADNSSDGSGAVYVFHFGGTTWYQQAYVKDPMARGDCKGTYRYFGWDVDLCAGGAGLVVGEGCGSSAYDFGAAHVFDFDGANWMWRASAGDSSLEGMHHGSSVSISEDGNTLAVGAPTIEMPVSWPGTAYVYRFNGQSWQRQATVQASNKDLNATWEENDYFGRVVEMSADGKFLAVAADGEIGGAVGINGDQYAIAGLGAGSVYVFGFDDVSWAQTAYVKASDTEEGVSFGRGLALSADGNTLVVGAPFVESGGAVYVY